MVSGILLGTVFTFISMAVVGYIYLRYGRPPVSVTDLAFPYEAQIVHIPLNARIDRELASAPFGTSPENLISGAQIYIEQCASRHGTPGQNSALAKNMYPSVPQLWDRHQNGVVGVSDDEPGKSYWKITNGIRLTGMPAFNHILTSNERWQVSLLLQRANQPLPSPVSAILSKMSTTEAQKGSAGRS